MKNFTKIIAVIIIALVYNTNVNAQNTATASATAIILTPIKIVNAGNMSFGTIIPTAAAGSVVLAPGGGTTLSNVTLHSSSSALAASFNVTGSPNLTYTVGIAPASVNITNGGGTTMSVGSFVSNPAVGAGTGLLDGTGAQNLRVGATLSVAANQEVGTYTNASAFTVTVNYN